MTKTVAIVSGGMDSVTLAYHLVQDLGHDLHLVSVDYGQRHRKEIQFAALAAERLNARHTVVDLSGITSAIATSSLTGDINVPDGHYAEESMRITVVPNRNLTMLSVACAIAVSENADWVATGVHGGDHFIYPDCRPEFISAANTAALIGNVGLAPAFKGITAPFVHTDKAGITLVGHKARVPWQETWSCYKGGDIHCGRCGTCVERQEAFHIAGVADPTVYEDSEFWKSQCGVTE